MLALMIGAGLAFSTAWFYQPAWFGGRPKNEEFRKLYDEVAALKKKHTKAFHGGLAVAGLIAWFFTGAGTASLWNARGGYFIRCGAGGVSVRVPLGLDWKKAFFAAETLERDIPWSEIECLTVTQVKQLGALSRTAGNVGGDIELRLRNGKSHWFGVELFGEPAYMIHERINEATRMTAWRDETRAGEYATVAS
jgi:hypothetical protein